MFVIYLLILLILLLSSPLIKIESNTSNEILSRTWLVSGHLFKTFLIIIISRLILFGWNTSFRFKNFIIGYLGFKENDALINFGLLRIIATAFIGIGDALNVVGIATKNINGTL